MSVRYNAARFLEAFPLSSSLESSSVPEGRAPRVPNLSIVIPVYNERDNLVPLWEELRAVLDRIGRTAEILFVDDCSRDGSAEVLSGLRKKDPAIRVLHLNPNSGQTAALLAGFGTARGEIVVTLDGDRQNDPSDIPSLLAKLPDFDAAVGYRANRADNWVRRISAKVSNAVRNAVSRDDIIDTGCMLKAFRTECLRALPQFNGMHRFLPTLLRMSGYKVCQLPVNHRPRVAGESKYGIGNRLFPALRDLFGVRWLQNRHMTYTVEEDA